MNANNLDINKALLSILLSAETTDNITKVRLYIERGANKEKAMETAWKERKYKYVVQLLIKDSKFPDSFPLYPFDREIELHDDLKDLVKERHDLHEDIKTGNVSVEKIRDLINRRGLTLFLNSKNKLALETAIESKADTKIIVALLGSDTATLSRQSVALNNKQIEIVSHISDSGQSHLMTAVKSGVASNISLILSMGIPSGLINLKHPATGKRAVDIAWDRRDFHTILKLLKSNSYFPSQFDISELSGPGIKEQLKQFALTRDEIHELVANGKENELISHIDDLKNKSSFFYNTKGKSLSMTAIENRQYKIFALLLSRKITLGSSEEEKEMLKLNADDRDIIQSFIVPLSFSTEKYYISFLVSKSRSVIKYKNFEKDIEAYYKELDSIPEVSKILQAAAHIHGLDIIFDHVGYSLVKLNQAGISMHCENRIFIRDDGHRTREEIVGTLSHELTHVVMAQVYTGMMGKPYHDLDISQENWFTNLSKLIMEQNFLVEGKEYTLFKNIIGSYPPQKFASEVIARFIQSFSLVDMKKMTLYPVIKEIRDHYNNVMIRDIDSFIKANYYHKVRSLVELQDRPTHQILYNVKVLEKSIFFPQSDLEDIQKFLTQSNSDNRILILKSKDLLPAALMVNQVLNVLHHSTHERFTTVIDQYVTSPSLVIKSLSDGANVLIVYCDPINIQDVVVDKAVNPLVTFLNSEKGKKAIFITQPKFYNKIINQLGLLPSQVVIKEASPGHSHIDLKKLNLEDKHVVLTPQEDDLYTSRKLGISSLLLDNESKIKNSVDLEVIIDLATNDEIRLSNNMPISSSENHYHLNQVIDTPTLERKLLSINKNEIYILTTQTGDLSVLKQILSDEAMKNVLEGIELYGTILVEGNNKFKDQNFKELYAHNPEKKATWISVKAEDNKVTVIVESVYDPIFYIARSFNKNPSIDNLVSNLGKPDLNEVLILKNVDNKKDFIISLELNDSQEENFKKNLNKGMIKIFNSRKIKKAESLSEKLSKEGKRFRYIEVKGTFFIEHIKEDDFVKKIQNEKLTIVSGDAGIGKTTTLTHLYNDKQNHEILSISQSHWGFRIDLSNEDHLQAITSINEIGIDAIADYLLKIHPPYDSTKHVTKFLLKESISGHPSLPILLVFDGFDEVLDQKDRENILSLIKFLKNSTKAKLWVTTRTNYEAYLEKELATSSTRLNGIDPILQEKLVRKYLDSNFLLLSNEANNDKYSEKIKEYTAEFLERNKDLLGVDLLRNPLNLNLLLENSKKDFESWMQGNDIKLKLNDPGKNIYEVYDKFVDKKYEAYLDKIGVMSKTKRNEEKTTLDKLFKRVSESIVLGRKKNLEYSQVELNKLRSVGLTKFYGKNVEFIHTSFKEYFVSKVFVKWLEKAGEKFSNEKLSHILEKVFTEPGYQMTRVFLNSLLRKTEIKEEALHSIGKSIVSIYRSNKSDQELLVNALVREREEQLVSLILNSIKILGDQELYQILTKVDKDGRNIVHYAADSEISGVATQVMNTINEKLTTLEIQSLLMLQDKGGKSPFHYAASNQLTEVMVSMLNVIDKKEISTEEILNILMLQDKEGNTVLHYIPDQLDGTAFSAMITFLFKERFSSKQIFKLFQLQNKNGETLLHIFADSQSGEMDESIYKIATFMKEKFNQEEIYSLLSKQNVNAETIFHYIAASELDLGIGQILELIEGNALSGENLYNLFSIKDNEGKTFLHHFPMFQSEETNWNIKRALDVMEKKLTRDQIHKLFSEQDKFGQTFLHYLPDSTGISSENLSNILTFIFKNFNTQEVYNLISIKTNDNGYSVIHSFVDTEYYFGRNKLFLDTLADKLEKTQLYELLSIKDSLGQTALISNVAGIEVLRKAKECGKMYDLLKIKDNKGKTPFHHISLGKASPDILNEVLANLDLDKISEMLMLKDIEGKIFLHYIREDKIAKDFIPLLKSLSQETIYKLASSLDKNGRTFLYDFVNMESDGKDILAFLEKKLDNKQIGNLLSTKDNIGQNILHVIGDHSTAIETQSYRDVGPVSNTLTLSVTGDDDYLKEVLDPILNLLKKVSPNLIYSLLTKNSNKGITPINYAANNPTTSKLLSLILIAVKETLSLDQLYDLLTHKDIREFSLIDYIKNNDDLDDFLEAIGNKRLPLLDMARDRGNQDLLDLLNSQPSIKRLKVLEKFEESKDAIGLKPSTSSCLPGDHRKRRSTCEENIGDLSQYNPLEEHIDQHTQSSSRLYSDIAYLFAMHSSGPNKINTQNIIHYNKNIGDLINEREINHSEREKDILRNHYEEAKDFISSYPKETLLTSVNYKDIQERKPIIFDNGKTSVLVSYNSGHYEIYSKDYNYGVVFETNNGVSFNNVQRFVKAHFRLHSGSSKYKLYKLAENLPPSYIDRLARFWSPDKVLSDLTLIEKGYLEKIDNIPAKVVRECFLLDEKVPEMKTLHENFFNYYSGRITIRVEEMHNVISQLSKEESQELMNLIEKHNFPIDKNYLNTIPVENRVLLESYHNKIHNRLNQLEPITIKELSDLSWKVLEESMSNHPDISPELKESSLKTFKNIYDSVARKTSGTGTQILFFLPDVIRSVNTGNYNQLAALGGMIAGDAAFNHGYEKLISKLEPVLSKSRTSLLRKLPITSPIFKVLTIHSIYELHSELSTLPANSEKREIIKHKLGEQYFTAALMCAEMIGGIETGPLWIGLMTEQLIYSGIAFRKENHLDISLTESIWMSLGFEQEKFQSLLKERKLLDINLSLVKTLSNQTNIDYDFAIVKVPKLIEIETKESEIAQKKHKEKWWSFIPFTSPSHETISNYLPLNTTIDFSFSKYTPKKYCMEDNVFLEMNNEYKRVSSTYTDDSNYCEEQPFPRILGDGLAALYAREKISNNSSIRNMISIFDPREGNLELKFTQQGMKKLDEYYGNNMTTPYYSIDVKVLYKPNPDKIQILKNTNKKFLLDDSSNRLISNYEINSTIPFRVNDNTHATSITLIGSKQSYINGSMSNFSIFSSNMHKTGGVLLTNKTHLNFNLLNENLVLDKLKIDVPSVNFLYRGRKIYNHLTTYSSIRINSNVIRANISTTPSTLLTVFRNSGNEIVYNFRFVSYNESTSVMVQSLSSSYTSYSINYFKKEIQDIIYNICRFRNHYDPKVKSIQSYSNQGHFHLANITAGSLSIEGMVNDNYAKIQSGSESISFQIALDSHKHTEVIPFSSTNIQLDNKKLKFKKVATYTDYGSSYCHSDNRYLPLFPVLEFYMSGEKVLYHLRPENSIFNVNGIDYKLSNNKIYVHTSSGEIDGNKLIKLDDTRTVSILINRNLKNSTVSLQEKKMKINNITLNGIPDQTLILFENSGKKPIPISVKMIRNALSATRDKRSFGRESLMSDVIKMNNYELSESKIIDSTESSTNSTDLLILKNYDVTSTVLLLDLFIRKLTGEKYHNTPPHSLSELEARGYILDIMEKFRMILEEAHKISECETPLNYQEEFDLYLLVTKYVKSGQFYEVSDALYSTAQKICPERNEQFMINVRSDIEEITGHRIQKETQNNKSIKLIGYSVLGTFLFSLSAFVCTKVVSYFTNRNTNESTRQENDQIPENENFIRSDTSVQAESVHSERRAKYSSVPYELSEIKSVLHKEENISKAV